MKVSKLVPNKKKLFWIWLCITLIVHMFLFLYKNYLAADYRPDSLQQENFSGYVISLGSGRFPKDLSYYDTRFFPGLPMLVLLFSIIFKSPIISGLLISTINLVLIYILATYFTKRPFYSFWLTMFPPIVFEQLSKISTESLVILGSLMLLYLLRNGKLFLLSLLGGFFSVVRPVSVFFSLPVFLQQLRKKDYFNLFKSTLLFLAFPLLLILFNIVFFRNPVHQIIVNSQTGKAMFPFLGIFFDFFENLSGGEYRILFSSFLYLLLALYVFYITLKHKGNFLFRGDGFYIKFWSLGVFLFIFLIGPSKFLSELRRFLAVFFPLLLIANYKHFINRKYFLYLSFFLVIAAFL